MKLSVVGGGNLGAAIARGYREANPKANVTVSQPLIHEVKHLEQYGINITVSNLEGIKDADIVVIAVKPFVIDLVLDEIKEHIQKQLIVSVVTGKGLEHMEQIIGRPTPIFRVMPNIAIAHRQSMSCISSRNASEDDQQRVGKLFSDLGEVIFVKESMMDACTVMAGSGIAFALRFIRAAMQAGIQIGFDANTSLKIVSQIMHGATALLEANQSHPEQEIDRVTTPKGCTIAGLNRMELEGFSPSVVAGIQHTLEAIEGIKRQK